MRFWIATGLSLSLAVLVGCKSSGTSGGGDDTALATPTKATRLTRYVFKDTGSNQETGGQIDKKGDTSVFIGAEGEEVLLSSYQGQPVLLVFMRGFAGFICPYCTTYTAQIATRYEEFKAAGAEVLIVYPTKEDDTQRIDVFVEACNEILEAEGADALPFPVLLDPGARVVKKYNLEWDLSRPASFVLDARGKIRYAYVGKTTDDRPSVDRVLREIQALSQE